MVYSLTYRRPAHVNESTASLNGENKPESHNSGSSGSSAGIPDALSFDNIINNGTCPPCTVRDFMNYLKYIEHSAENLQFFLWFHDYNARFNNLSESERVLSPEWTRAQAEAEATSAAQQVRSNKANVHATAILQGTSFDDGNGGRVNEKGDPFNTPPPGSFDESRNGMTSDYGSSMGDDTLVSSATARGIASQAFGDAGMKWQPFTTQPYRDEISRIITVYIADNSPRELNISSREKQALLHALQNTTHPSAFHSIIATVEYSLRRQSHPNFIRWAICNGNRPRVIFARGLGVFTIAAGLIADLIITLSSAGRAWRVIPFLGWFIGIATLIAAWKGMCVVLHGMHHRHLRPWELFADSTDEVSLTNEKSASHDSLVSSSGNSFEDEPWVPKYAKRNFIRRIFDREVWIQEPALRQIQDTIFLQSLLGAFVLSCIFVGIFCAVPHGNFF